MPMNMISMQIWWLRTHVSAMINLLRWIGIVPTVIAGWYLALITGLFLFASLDSLCPPEELVSGMCNASWYPLASRLLICFGAALSAFLVVLVASLVAPSQRKAVAWVAYAIGAVIAFYMAILASRSSSHYLELMTALIAGLLAVWAVHRFPAPKRSVLGD